MIHSTAIVSPNAQLGVCVEVGPYAIVEANVEIGDGSSIDSHAIVKSGSRIGKNVTIGNYVVIGGLPQDLSFDPSTPTYAVIGEGTALREGATVNRATQPEGSTVVGENCYLMAQSHVGHDSQLGERVVLANGAMVAGFVTIGSFSFMGGGAGIHQYNRVGEGVMIGGNAAISLDIAPFAMVADRNELHGLNVVGLRRRKVPREHIQALKECYRAVLVNSSNIKQKAAELLQSSYGEIEEAQRFLEFFEEGKRGFARAQRA